ncbi:ABC transporter permease [Radiobacillus sp. PE A8.2]|uniref:ABC transporter permease n=1 Tax=Radiobacillus sp. PE A8.2 TaxID=3380349 RepID=UPI00388F1CE5
MRSLTIAGKDLLIRLTDWKGFVTMLLLPVILTAILGSALSSAFSDDGALPETVVGIYVDDHDEMGERFVEDVLMSDQLEEQFTVHMLESSDQIETQLLEQSIDVGIHFPSSWWEALLEGSSPNVKIMSTADQQLQSNIVQSMLDSYVTRISTIAMSIDTVVHDIAAQTRSTAIDPNAFASSLRISLEKVASEDIEIGNNQSTDEISLSGMQYYAAAMGAMFLLFNITVGAKSFIEERSTETFARLLVAPINKKTIIIGKWLGTFYFSLLQFVVFVLSTHFLFDVNWGSNLYQLAVIAVTYSISVAGLSMLIATIFTSEKSIDTIGGLGIQVLALLGGSMLPISLFPDSLLALANLTPNKWALSSLLDVMSGTTWNSLLLPMAILLLVGFISMIYGSFKLKI